MLLRSIAIMNLSFPAPAKGLLVSCLLGLTLTGCIVTPDRYETRQVVRYEKPYPVYRDRVYTQTQRVYVPYAVREREKIYINQRSDWRADNNRNQRWDDNKGWDKRDNDKRRKGWSRGWREQNNNRDDDRD